MTEAEEHRQKRAALRPAYGKLYEQVSQALFEADPGGINFGDNTDEYEPEVDTILPRLADCTGPDDVQKVLHEEFGRWLGVDDAGPIEDHAALAVTVWGLESEWRHLTSRDLGGSK